MSKEKDQKILPPYKVSAKGRSVIDWDILTRMYLDQKQTAKDFLDQFKHIDITKKKTLDFLKRWETEKNKQAVKNYTIRRNVQKLAEVEMVDEETILKRIEFLKSRQALSDHEAAESIKHALLEQVNRANCTIAELAMISKSLEVVSKIQRISLGLPPNGTNEDASLTAGDEKPQNLEKASKVPTFVVEMNDNGKFKRLKPRRTK